eukprot:UN00472
MRQLIRVRNSKKKTSKIHALFSFVLFFFLYFTCVFLCVHPKIFFFGSPVP